MFASTAGAMDASFRDVSGIATELDTEAVPEGGENRFVHTLPKGVKHPHLELKRGIASMTSPLVMWCRSVFEGEFTVPIRPQSLMVQLLDELHLPIRIWTFANAFPVKWEIESFGSTKNEVAIEKIVLSYTYSNRMA